MIEHQSLVDYVAGLVQEIKIDRCESFALVATLATDLGNTVIYSSFLSGGALHIFSKESISNIEYIHRYFKEHHISCLKIVPSHWNALKMDDTLLLPEKLLIFGGEALPVSFIENIKFDETGCKVINHYGPTETTVGKLLHLVNRDQVYQNTIPIGQPFSNAKIYVLNNELQLCPVGIAGQLYIAGDGVARGYWNNSSLTNEKFIKNPFQSEVKFTNGERMYGTGDLVKRLSDGNIQFVGRVDDQVKIRGYRIELGEIESVMRQSNLVNQAVVLANEDKQGNKKLIGYVIANEEFDREGMLSYLKEKLPDYMIPSVLIELESLPLTANGKVDKKALPDPESALQGAEYIAPRNQTECTLKKIWEDILDVDP